MPTDAELIAYLDKQINHLTQTISGRIHTAEMWERATDQDMRDGNRLARSMDAAHGISGRKYPIESKAERAENANRERRIAAKEQIDIDMLRAIRQRISESAAAVKASRP